MAVRAKSICPGIRCGALVEKPGLCASCRASRSRAHDRVRGSAASRGYGALHRRWRAAILARDVICQDPHKRHVGHIEPATVADHVVPLARGGSWDLSNGMGMCGPCHNFKTAKHDGGFGRLAANR